MSFSGFGGRTVDSSSSATAAGDSGTGNDKVSPGFAEESACGDGAWFASSS